MLKLMIKNVKSAVAAARRQRVKFKLTRKNLFVWLPEPHGGGLHVLPRPGQSAPMSFKIAQAEAGYALEMVLADAAPKSLATFATEGDAKEALVKLNKALTGTRVFKWAAWAVVAWLAWLFVTSYLQVTANAAGSTQPEFSPPAAMEPQAMPSVAAAEGGSANLSDYIYQQAMAAKAKAEHSNMPPTSGGDAKGLDSFGLKTEGQAGPGCDPGLAFTVPAQPK